MRYSLRLESRIRDGGIQIVWHSYMGDDDRFSTVENVDVVGNKAFMYASVVGKWIIYNVQRKNPFSVSGCEET